MSENESHHDSRAAGELASVDFDYAAIDGEESVDAAEAYRQAARAVTRNFRSVFMVIQDNKGDKALAFDCATFALGMKVIARAKSESEIAERHNVSKSRVVGLIRKMQTAVLTDSEMMFCNAGSSIIDDAFSSAYLVAFNFYKGIFQRIKRYRGDKAFAFDCAMLALGWEDLAKAKTQEDIAKRYNCGRANVAREVKSIQCAENIPPMAGQRNEAARAKFSQARKLQLKAQ